MTKTPRETPRMAPVAANSAAPTHSPTPDLNGPQNANHKFAGLAVEVLHHTDGGSVTNRADGCTVITDRFSVHLRTWMESALVTVPGSGQRWVELVGDPARDAASICEAANR